MLLDLDHFKDINDTLGHQYGDDLLADLGPRLAQRVGEGGLVARFGGDEFAILPAGQNRQHGLADGDGRGRAGLRARAGRVR